MDSRKPKVNRKGSCGSQGSDLGTSTEPRTRRFTKDRTENPQVVIHALNSKLEAMNPSPRPAISETASLLVIHLKKSETERQIDHLLRELWSQDQPQWHLGDFHLPEEIPEAPGDKTSTGASLHDMKILPSHWIQQINDFFVLQHPNMKDLSDFDQEIIYDTIRAIVSKVLKSKKSKYTWQ